MKTVNLTGPNAKFCLMKTSQADPRMVEKEYIGRGTSNVVPNNYDSNIDEWDYKWEGPTVTWKLDQPNNDLQPYDVQRILTLSFMAWQLQIKDIKFRFLRRSTADADIPIAFLGKNDDKLFKDSPSTLAYAYFPTKSLIGGDMVFNDEYIWSADGRGINAHLADPINYPDPNTNVKIRTYNLQHTGVHEIGHAIGLKHAVNCPQCVMHPYYNNEVQPQPNDIERIRGIYGKRNLPSWLLALLLNRIRRGWNARS